MYDALEKEDGVRVAFSAWNVGEVIGAIDTRQQRGDINKESMAEAISLFVGETKKFVAMRKVLVFPITAKMLEGARDLILKYHVYEADALQIASARRPERVLFMTADKKLAECAEMEKLEVANPERDHDKVIEAVGSPSPPN